MTTLSTESHKLRYLNQLICNNNNVPYNQDGTLEYHSIALHKQGIE